MKVFKFGGASLKDAAGVKNVTSIITQSASNNLLVVVSAMGKTTNALEKIWELACKGKSFEAEWAILGAYHHSTLQALFEPGHTVFTKVDGFFDNLKITLLQSPDADLLYDQTVSLGELISSVIISEYLSLSQATYWLDARTVIKTDNTYREGTVDWATSKKAMEQLTPVLQNNIVITQGFIGGTPDGLTTTLGREGSDYSAAIFASCLAARSVTIWKDVPGVMNADPKRFPDAVVFEELPFKEAAEMTYYGASVIHPKTIKPLANKGIPLLVKNFQDPSLPGTRIHECKVDHLPPLIVFKENQCLVSCKVTDYSFINEQQLMLIFHALAELNLHVNVMQNSAISLSFCLDFRENKVLALIQKLQQHFEVYYNTGLTLITIKNHDAETSKQYRNYPRVLLEQSSRSTLQVLVRL